MDGLHKPPILFMLLIYSCFLLGSLFPNSIYCAAKSKDCCAKHYKPCQHICYIACSWNPPRQFICILLYSLFSQLVHKTNITITNFKIILFLFSFLVNRILVRFYEFFSNCRPNPLFLAIWNYPTIFYYI